MSVFAECCTLTDEEKLGLLLGTRTIRGRASIWCNTLLLRGWQREHGLIFVLFGTWSRSHQKVGTIATNARSTSLHAIRPVKRCLYIPIYQIDACQDIHVLFLYVRIFGVNVWPHMKNACAETLNHQPLDCRGRNGCNNYYVPTFRIQR